VKGKSKMKVTVDYLEKNHACEGGIVWFRDNYPAGVTINRNEITSLFDALMKRTMNFLGVPFIYPENNQYDTCRNLDWLLSTVTLLTVTRGQRTGSHFCDISWTRRSREEIIDCWMKCYNNYHVAMRYEESQNE